MGILTLNVAFSTLVFWIAARLYVVPRLPDLAPRTVLLPVLLLHGLRHLGMMFLSAGATFPGVPAQFAYPAALGDLVAAVLAVIAIPAVSRGDRIAKPLVWTFNVWGTVDLASAITLATMYDTERYMGPAYWIPAFWVPGLLVTHWLTFIVLVKPWPVASSVTSARAY